MGKFRIKIAPSWFSEDYIVLKYSTNGIFWKTINELKYDSFYNWYYMGAETHLYTMAEKWLSKFKTIEDVKKYENEQRKMVVEHNKRISDENKKNNEERDKIYNKYGH